MYGDEQFSLAPRHSSVEIKRPNNERNILDETTKMKITDYVIIT